MSAAPVETAMSGMLSSVSPDATVPGSASDLSGCALSVHAVTSTVNESPPLADLDDERNAAPTGALFSVKRAVGGGRVLATAPLW